MSDERVLRILTGAKTILVERGWCQGAYAKGGTPETKYSPTDPRAERFCVLGATIRAEWDAYPDGVKMDRSTVRHRTSIRLRQAVGEVSPDHLAPATYNDTPGRTREEMVAIIDKAIEKEAGGDE